MKPILILICTQIVFSASDLLARANLSKYGWAAESFYKWWFVGFVFLRIVATIAQLYIFARIPIGKSAALFGAVSILLSNLLGLLLLNESLSLPQYLGISCAVLAFVILAWFG